MKLRTFTILVSLLLAVQGTLFSQNPGTLDLTFANNGQFVLDNGQVDLFTDVEIRPDGKIIAVGITYDPTFAASTQVMRFTPDGAVDQTFANNGIFTYSLNAEANIFDLVIRPNGKILMVGSTTDYNVYNFLLLQLNEDGIPDNSFGTNGVVVQKISALENFYEDHAYAVALQSDGKFVVAGKSHDNDYRFSPVVVRFTENGQLDSSFGTSGVARINVSESENDFDGVLVQPDGKIVASGHIANTFLSFAMLVVRFMPDGTLDQSFDSDGILNWAYSGVDDEGFDITMTEDNNYLVSGFTTTVTYNYSMLLIKLNQQGGFVTDFGTNGVVIADQGSYDVGAKVLVQADNKILVGGGSGDSPPNDADFAVWRYNPNGTPDNTFGTNGLAKVQFSGNFDEALSIALQPDGKIIAVGKARSSLNFDFAMVRFYNDISIGVNELEKSTVSISPNPVKQGDMLNVEFELVTPGNVTLKFINSMGRVSGIVEAGYFAAGKNQVQIWVPSSLATGVYLVRVNDGFSSKLLIQK